MRDSCSNVNVVHFFWLELKYNYEASNTINYNRHCKSVNEHNALFVVFSLGMHQFYIVAICGT